MSKKIYRLDTAAWSVERIVFLSAGIFICLSLALAFLVNKNFLYFTAFVGLMLINFALTGYCPLAILIGKFKRID